MVIFLATLLFVVLLGVVCFTGFATFAGVYAWLDDDFEDWTDYTALLVFFLATAVGIAAAVTVAATWLNG